MPRRSLNDNFLHTTDGGATWTWTAVGYNDSASINRIRVFSPMLAFASGRKIFHLSAPILPRPRTLRNLLQKRGAD